MRRLYLGLKAPPETIHYPVIRTEMCKNIQIPQHIWPQVTHIIFTSQTAVHYWSGPWDKKVIAIGPATAAAVQQKGIVPLVAKEFTQEGVIAILKEIKGFFFFPKSSRSRPALIEYFSLNKIPFFALDLYDTLLQKLEPVPSLDEIDEIIFSSPSTVQGFIQIYGQLPKDKKLTPIGPITAKELASVEKNRL
jgi:uroporphyrinogen-III synthase